VEIKYGKGFVKGTEGSELVGFSQDLLLNCSLLLIDEGKDLEEYIVTDGMMGLGSRESANDFIDLAYKAGHIQDKVFSFNLDHNKDYTGEIVTKDSYLSIGYIPEDYANKVSWLPVTSPASWVKNFPLYP